MTTIETIKSAINEELDHAQMKVEALSLQTTLGKADLADNLKDKRESAINAATELSKYLESIGVTANDLGDNINSEVENLKLQVALGKMESKESLEKAKDALTKCAGQFEDVVGELKIIQHEKISEVKGKLSTYMAKMSQLKATIEAKVVNNNA